MIAYHHKQLPEGYSQLVAAIPMLAPGEIAEVLAQLPSSSPQVPMTSVTAAVPHDSSSSSFASQTPDISIPLVIQQMILKHGLDEV